MCTAPSFRLQVRLWSPFQGANNDLYVERWDGTKWANFKQSATGNWNEQVSFSVKAGEQYRFRYDKKPHLRPFLESALVTRSLTLSRVAWHALQG
jgi:hypothetical protein